MKYFIGLIVLVLSFSFLLSEKNIVEKVEVDWWVVPMFAVDGDDNSVTDLYKDDIEILINKKAVKDFSIFKRRFSILDIGAEQGRINSREEKGKMAFLIFDIAFKSKTTLEKSKDIAAELISKSSGNSLFVIMTLDPFAGLQYLFGPSNDKGHIYDVLRKKIKMLPDSRNLLAANRQIDQLQIGGRSGAKGGESRMRYAESGLNFFAEQLAAIQIQMNKHFFSSFESLYYSLNQITDNKFLFFFSEGLSMQAANLIPHGVADFFNNLKKSARYMGRSGSVIFIIDPSIPGTDFSSASGSDSMKSLALESGGKYMRGNKKDVSKRLENMNRAYYEIAFASSSAPGGEKIDIEIRSRRKGVKIHSLKSLEERKQYSDMSKIEREVLVLNLLERNRFFRSPLEMRGFDVIKKKRRKNQTDFLLNLPGDYKRKYLDLFIAEYDPENKEDVSVRVSREEVAGNMFKFKVGNDVLRSSRIVLVDERNGLAYIDGMIDIEDRFIKNLEISKRKFKQKSGKMSESEKVRLDFILKGTEEYCEELETAAFHFVCTEDISEMSKKVSRRWGAANSKYGLQSNDMIRRPIPGEFESDSVKKITRDYSYDYQLIQANSKVFEQRRPVKGAKVVNLNSGLNVESFISRKIALTPIAIFGVLNRSNFNFRLVKFEKIQGVEAAIIEVFPADDINASSIYGKVWVDTADNSIMRIVVNPVSIGGFRDMFKLSKQLGSILDVKCRIDYDLKRDGLRFPTSVTITERYHGGSFLKNTLGVVSWERSKAVYNYSDYMFFGVKAEILSQE